MFVFAGTHLSLCLILTKALYTTRAHPYGSESARDVRFQTICQMQFLVTRSTADLNIRCIYLFLNNGRLPDEIHLLFSVAVVS